MSKAKGTVGGKSVKDKAKKKTAEKKTTEKTEPAETLKDQHAMDVVETRVVKRRRVQRNLAVDLSEPDQRKIGVEMAQAQAQLQEAELVKAKESKRLSDEVKRLTGKVRSLAQVLNDGYEMRIVDCEEVRDYQRGAVSVMRLDTGECVSERVMSVEELMSVEERQISMIEHEDSEHADEVHPANEGGVVTHHTGSSESVKGPVNSTEGTNDVPLGSNGPESAGMDHARN